MQLSFDRPGQSPQVPRATTFSAIRPMLIAPLSGSVPSSLRTAALARAPRAFVIADRTTRRAGFERSTLRFKMRRSDMEEVVT